MHAFVHWACYFVFNASHFLCQCCEYTFLTFLKFLVCMHAGNERVPPAREKHTNKNKKTKIIKKEKNKKKTNNNNTRKTATN